MDSLKLLSLSPTELRLFLAFQHLSDGVGNIDASMEELGELTGYGRTSLWKALGGLELAGLVATTRTKRNFGKLWRNRYLLLVGVPVQEKVSEPVTSPSSLEQTSTHDYSDSVTTMTTMSNITLNTSYLMGAAGPEEEEKMVNRWSEDDDIGGFGLLEGETPAGLKAKPVSKRDPKTRWLRPQEEWTAADMASEFAFRVYDRVRGIPGLVNTKELRGALAANRKRFGITALIEFEVLEKFFGDERNLAMIRKNPKKCHGMFLNAITNKAAEVISELGLEDELDTPQSDEYIYASDGKKFDNSMPGRAALERYQNKLEG
jgi:hypothetical protein